MKNVIKWLCITFFWLIVWQLAAMTTANTLLLPAPRQVLLRLGTLAVTSPFWLSVWHSLRSVLLGVLTAVVLGSLSGVLSARFSLLHDLLYPLLSVIKATPVASFIILALVWITRTRLPAFISGLIVLPIVWTNVEQGVRSIDHDLLEVAKVFRFSPLKTLWHISLPSVLPYFAAALRASLGMAWKAGIAAEVLATPKNTVGQSLFEAKVMMETTDMFAWTLTVILLSLILEKLVVYSLEALLKKTHTKEEGGNRT